MYRCVCSSPLWNLKLLGTILLSISAAVAEPSPTSIPVSATLASTSLSQECSAPAPTGSSKSIETCISASVNHITNRLPQQCWTGSTSTRTSEVPSVGTNTTHSATERSNVTPAPVLANQEQAGNTSSLSSPSTTQDRSQQGASNPVSSSTASSAVTVETTNVAESETDSPLDNAQFLSFEDWKKRHLEQAGEGADALVNERKIYSQDRRRPGVNNALDGLGDDSEIEFTFNPFGGSNDASSEESTPPNLSPAEAPTRGASPSTEDTHRRSKDAGKTCKERSNYASFDCAANVLKTNPKCKSSSSILVENKDSYMLNECSMDNKFLIVELCENVMIDTVVLANFEFFSSMFRRFRVSGSSHYPPKPDQWMNLGTFEAKNSRDIQAFLVEPPRYARYLRVEFLTHYGSEYYCPVSLLRIHGMTMYEEFLRSQQDGRDNDDEEDTPPSGESLPRAIQDTVTVVSEIKEERTVSLEAASGNGNSNLGSSAPALPNPIEPSPEQISPSATASADVCISTASREPSNIIFATPEKCAADSTPPTVISKEKAPAVNPTSTSSVQKSSSKPTDSVTPLTSSEVPASHNTTTRSDAGSSSAKASASDASETLTASSKNTNSQSALNTPSPTATLVATQNNNLQAAPAPPAYKPPTQESFFKSIHKRLQALEANATLSLQYIESQSALLRDAFAKVEKRQLAKTSTFLETLNITVATELARFKNDYDQLWQSAVMELASQREESRRERELLGERVRVLAQEMVNQKRLMAAQATLLLLSLGLLIFTKMGAVGPIDSGLLQGMQEIVTKAKQAKLREADWKWDSPWQSPSKRYAASPRRGGHESPEPGINNMSSRGDGLGIDSSTGTPNYTADGERSLSPVQDSPVRNSVVVQEGLATTPRMTTDPMEANGQGEFDEDGPYSTTI